MSNKLSKFEILRGFVALAVIVTIYAMVSSFVLNIFWNLVLKLVNKATKLAGGGGGTKSSLDVAVADQLLAKIDEIAVIFAETKAA